MRNILIIILLFMIVMLLACNNTNEHNSIKLERKEYISSTWIQKDCTCASRSSVWYRHGDEDPVQQGCLPYDSDGLNIIRNLTTCDSAN